MEILSKTNLIDTLKFMILVAEGSPDDSYFAANTEFSQVDKDFQERAHKMGLARALKLQKETETKKDNM